MLSRAKKLKPGHEELEVATSTLSVWGVDTSCSTDHTKVCMWPKPHLNLWALNCDGAMDANRVRYEGLFRDETGMPSLAYFGPRTKHHVLWAELQAIYRGVSLAIPRGWCNL